jgi:hypothetical protein
VEDIKVEIMVIEEGISKTIIFKIITIWIKIQTIINQQWIHQLNLNPQFTKQHKLLNQKDFNRGHKLVYMLRNANYL